MGKITKVKDINIAKLNNAEYRTFMARYGSLIAGDGHLHQPPQRADRRDQRPLQPTHSARESRRRQEASG